VSFNWNRKQEAELDNMDVLVSEIMMKKGKRGRGMEEGKVRREGEEGLGIKEGGKLIQLCKVPYSWKCHYCVFQILNGSLVGQLYRANFG